MEQFSTSFFVLGDIGNVVSRFCDFCCYSLDDLATGCIKGRAKWPWVLSKVYSQFLIVYIGYFDRSGLGVD